MTEWTITGAMYPELSNQVLITIQPGCKTLLIKQGSNLAYSLPIDVSIMSSASQTSVQRSSLVSFQINL